MKRWLAFLMAIVMVFLAIPNYMAEAAEDMTYDVKDYKGDKDQSEWTVPTETGKVFAGWYTDKTYSTPYTKTTGQAYPKFVDANVLTVKKQLKANVTSASKTTDIRFITSIDTAKFSCVGFEVEVDCEPVVKFDLQERTAYSSIVAKGQTLSNAAKVFGTKESAYFVTHSITGIPNAVFDNTFTVKPYWKTLDGTKVYGTTRNFVINDDLLEDSLVANKVTVNGTTFDMSGVIKYIDGTAAPTDGYYNYHLTNKTVTNLCNNNRSIIDSTRKVLYLNKVLTGSFTFETKIDMSSLDNETYSPAARQGIVLSDGTKELAIFLAKYTTENKKNDEVEVGTGTWYIHNKTTGLFVTDAGTHAGVGKCVSKNYASEITLKVEKVGNTQINLYVEDELITVLKPDGFYKADGTTKSTVTTFNDDLASLFTSEELVIGLNHFNGKDFPGIIYSDIKLEEGLVTDKVTVNGKTFDMSGVIKYIDGNTAPADGYYNYHLTNKTVTNLCNAKHSMTGADRKVLYLNKVLTGSFTFETTIDMSSLADKTTASYARQGIVLSNGTIELAITPGKWTNNTDTQDNSLPANEGRWCINNGTENFVTLADAGEHVGVGKCISTNYVDKITLKIEKIGNEQFNLYVNGQLITILKADGIYNGTTDNITIATKTMGQCKSAGIDFTDDFAELLASEELVIGLNHASTMNNPNIVYSDIKFVEIDSKESLVVDKVNVNDTIFDMSEVIKYIDGNTAPADGYYNYHLTNKTVTNLCNAKHSMTGADRKVLYLNKVLTGSFTFETTIDMSSLADKTTASYARQGIVLSNGTIELAITPGKWTNNTDTQDNSLPANEGRWCINNGTENFVTLADAGEHVGVGKCISTNYVDKITLKIEKIGNEQFNLYVNGQLITILKADGIYNGTTDNITIATKTMGQCKSAGIDFTDDFAELLASEELVIGLNHASTMNNPNIVYSDIKFNHMEEVYLSSTNGNDSNTGSKCAPVATLSRALDVVASGGKIVVCDDYIVPSDFEWEEKNNTLTIMGDDDDDNETLSFTNFSENVGIGDNVTFDHITLGFNENTNFFANGYTLVIGEHVTTTKPIKLYGGGNRTAVTSTNLTILSGNYYRIYGGSFVGTVTGDTTVYIGGTTNVAANPASHDETYSIFGGGHYDTIKGNTYLTFTGEAKANFVYGGSYGTATVKGTNVMFSGGKIMSLYGGNYSDSGVSSTKVQVTGGEMEQLFGANQYASMTGDVVIELTGGKITRRVYGGCYNDYGWSGWGSSNYVNGTINLKIASGVNISLDASYDDRAIYACSRYGSVNASEKCTITFMDATAYATYSGKLGAADSTMKNIMKNVNSSVESDKKYYTLILDY